MAVWAVCFVPLSFSVWCVVMSRRRRRREGAKKPQLPMSLWLLLVRAATSFSPYAAAARPPHALFFHRLAPVRLFGTRSQPQQGDSSHFSPVLAPHRRRRPRCPPPPAAHSSDPRGALPPRRAPSCRSSIATESEERQGRTHSAGTSRVGTQGCRCFGAPREAPTRLELHVLHRARRLQEPPHARGRHGGPGQVHAPERGAAGQVAQPFVRDAVRALRHQPTAGRPGAAQRKLPDAVPPAEGDELGSLRPAGEGWRCERGRLNLPAVASRGSAALCRASSVVARVPPRRSVVSATLGTARSVSTVTLELSEASSSRSCPQPCSSSRSAASFAPACDVDRRLYLRAVVCGEGLRLSAARGRAAGARARLPHARLSKPIVSTFSATWNTRSLGNPGGCCCGVSPVCLIANAFQPPVIPSPLIFSSCGSDRGGKRGRLGQGKAAAVMSAYTRERSSAHFLASRSGQACWIASMGRTSPGLWPPAAVRSSDLRPGHARSARIPCVHAITGRRHEKQRPRRDPDGQESTSHRRAQPSAGAERERLQRGREGFGDGPERLVKLAGRRRRRAVEREGAQLDRARERDERLRRERHPRGVQRREGGAPLLRRRGESASA